jgi:hypothetical protein
MSVLVFLDGVLRKDIGSPIVQGVALFRSLQEKRRTVILCKEKSEVEIWLRQNNIIKVDDVVSHEDAKSTTDVDLVEYCRSRGYVDTVVTADPDVAKELLERGITSLLFLSAKYIRPEFRPDGRKGVKSWEALQHEVDRQEELYREDPRV